jgi:flagellar basal-body rod protein FlgB
VFDLSQIPIFALADRKLAWIDQRQQVLAANIANADTPGWRARDMTPFAAQLGHAGIALAQTDPAHLGRTAPTPGSTLTKVGERAPDGNTVELDKQLMNVADTDTAQEVTTQLTQGFMGMFRTAIGR